MNLYTDRYVSALTSTRDLIETHPTTSALLSKSMTPHRLERFLIEYCARAIHLTEPADGWIRRAGAACRAAGFESLGSQLERQAKHEEGHHLMLMSDARAMAEGWNRRGDFPAVDVEALLLAPPSRAALAYIELHEVTIASSQPYAQVAIELEIENLSIRFGPPLIQQIRHLLGGEAMKKLTFIEDHVEVDVGHAALKEKMMTRLLDEHPHTLEPLVRTGDQALCIYLDFFEECLRGADEDLNDEIGQGQTQDSVRPLPIARA